MKLYEVRNRSIDFTMLPRDVLLHICDGILMQRLKFCFRRIIKKIFDHSIGKIEAYAHHFIRFIHSLEVKTRASKIVLQSKMIFWQ